MGVWEESQPVDALTKSAELRDAGGPDAMLAQRTRSQDRRVLVREGSSWDPRKNPSKLPWRKSEPHKAAGGQELQACLQL